MTGLQQGITVFIITRRSFNLSITSAIFCGVFFPLWICYWKVSDFLLSYQQPAKKTQRKCKPKQNTSYSTIWHKQNVSPLLPYSDISFKVLFLELPGIPLLLFISQSIRELVNKHIWLWRKDRIRRSIMGAALFKYRPLYSKPIKSSFKFYRKIMLSITFTKWFQCSA